MQPIQVRFITKKGPLFEDYKRERIISFEKLYYDNQTSLEFCLFEGENKTWYRLYDASGLEKTKIKFIYSNGKLDVTGIKENGESTKEIAVKPIENINNYLNELWNHEKYWELLGIREGSPNFGEARNNKIQQIFHDEQDVHGIINGAYQKIEEIIETFGFVDVELDSSSIDVYLDGVLKGELPCTINSGQGEHNIVLKKGSHEIGSTIVQINPKERKKIPISISDNGSADNSNNELEAQVQNLERENNRYMQRLRELERGITPPSKVTLSLLVLLTIMSAIDIVWSPSPLFIFYLISFIGVFYKTKWGSGLSIFSGFIAFLKFDPLLLLLGIFVMVLGWKEYSALKTS